MSETDRAERWRSLAAEVLDLAKELSDPAAKKVMLAGYRKPARPVRR